MSIALAGFFARASADAELVALVGRTLKGRVRVEPDYPAAPLKEAACPMVTYTLNTDDVRSAGMHEVRLQVDVWVWPGDTARQRLADIDRRLLALFDEQGWQHEGVWLYAVAGTGRDFPAPSGTPLRRMRMLRIDTAPLG
jgi:hypothetical protein